MSKQSAGLLIYRLIGNKPEVLIAHPGGPFWAKKDDHAWSIPKGLFEDDEDSLQAAHREFKEEIGQAAPPGEPIDLGSVKLASGKTVYAWAIEGNLDVSEVSSNTFSIEWPPRSGQKQEFPEIDRVEWFELSAASVKLHPGLDQFLIRLAQKLGLDFDNKNNAPKDGELNDRQTSLL